MNWAINTLWDLENRTLDLGMGDSLLQVRNVLKQIKDEMVVEREKRLKRDEEEMMGSIMKWVKEQQWIQKDGEPKK